MNELQTRDTDSNSSTNYSLVYDGAGNLTDDNKDYKYAYDVFYRLRNIKKTGNSALVAEYRYNGLGYKIAAHEDTDTDNDVDSSDKWYYDAFDERWRQLARFRESDAYPKIEYVDHAAGAQAGSSYVDHMMCRYRDANTSWTAASDGTLEERLYCCQNQHADVAAVVLAAGTQSEACRYSAFGIPFGLPGGDTDSDGDCDSADASAVQALIDAPAYDVRADLDLDGDVDATDKSTLLSAYSGITSGRGVLTGVQVSNVYSFQGRPLSKGLINDRRREQSVELGRWVTRDPAEYVDGPNSYAYCGGMSVVFLDPSGASTESWPPPGNAAGWVVGPGSHEYEDTSVPNDPCKCRSHVRVVNPNDPGAGVNDPFDSYIAFRIKKNETKSGNCCSHESCRFKFNLGVNIEPVDSSVDQSRGSRYWRYWHDLPGHYPNWPESPGSPNSGSGTLDGFSEGGYKIDEQVSCGEPPKVLYWIAHGNEGGSVGISLHLSCKSCGLTDGSMASVLRDPGSSVPTGPFPGGPDGPSTPNPMPGGGTVPTGGGAGSPSTGHYP